MNQRNFGAPALAVADWRRQVFALYRDIRAENDPATAHAQWQAGRNELLANHPASPVPPEQRATYAGAPVAPYRTDFRFEATIETDVKPFSWEFQSATDGVIPFSRVGVLQLPVGDLDVWWLESYGGGLFVPVKDALAGTSTYGGGRYLIDTVKGADLGGDLDEFVVDLNFAYNPSCAYSPEWTCPLAPATNVIGAELPVGELTSASTDL
ncbi:DUF1684 domain-containing protein [Kribbella sp. VKM Ac-2566]|uniref:DUF1684 domain-containing protein n=1 Tax=Kribbella sp. VKM Ac-2566 TaxID=2512218 RepID=UPI0010D15026|nr:DUF1684 domain-containing protein [Kribbella sp. VKM Ac-2566]TDW86580.1 hypothetical protein EV647_6677 [Kribbella sp. VKM Ac-2566]